VFNAASFAVATILIAGVNLFALALVLNLLLGWSIAISILAAAAIVLIYITLGGLTSAIYNEVIQFFVIIAALIPLVVVSLVKIGGVGGLKDSIHHSALGKAGTHAWQGLGVAHHSSPLDTSWIALIFGLGFVLSFGYWTTNYAEVQRALSAKNLSAAQRTPLIGAYPKIFIPALTIIPGLVALVTIHGLGAKTGTLQYNNSIPLLIGTLFPTGILGLAITGLMASFMAGVAANVTAFNTVVTYDLWQDYVQKDRSPEYYIRFGRIATVVGVVVAIGTAFIAKGYSNMMNYVQLLFSYFNAPLFATFIIGMFWKRTTAWGGFFGLIAGTAGAFITHELASNGVIHLGSQLAESFWGAMVAFVADAVVTVTVSLATQPKTDEEMRGLVWGLTRTDEREEELTAADRVWWRNPKVLAAGAIALIVALNIIFI
jgi:SSS family solute:Na+ symporter